MFGAQTFDRKVMKYSADSVEWCPINEFHNIFACGTYQLVNNEQERAETPSNSTRLGDINLFKVNQQGLLVLQHCMETPAVLDLRWCHQTNCLNEPMLAVANAEGAVIIYYLKKRGDILELLNGESICCVEKKGILLLSVDWAVGSDGSLQLVISDSSGSISVLRMNGDSLEKIHNWSVHMHEAWTATFDNQDPNVVYSGGDDCRLVVYDLRQKREVLCLMKQHNSGVTALSVGRKHNVLASGSYDEKLRLWDKRNWKSAYGETALGGGVWRIKWHPYLDGKMQNHLLVACMHAGFKLVDCTEVWEGGSISESLTYSEHDSLAYGCDWCHDKTPGQFLCSSEAKEFDIKGLIATCSFYDHKLCVWSLY